MDCYKKIPPYVEIFVIYFQAYFVLSSNVLKYISPPKTSDHHSFTHNKNINIFNKLLRLHNSLIVFGIKLIKSSYFRGKYITELSLVSNCKTKFTS